MNQCFLDANDIQLDYTGECKRTIESTAESTVIQSEPQMDPEPQSVQKCGQGTILVDGHCQVIANDKPKEQKGFIEWLMSLFGM